MSARGIGHRLRIEILKLDYGTQNWASQHLHQSLIAQNAEGGCKVSFLVGALPSMLLNLSGEWIKTLSSFPGKEKFLIERFSKIWQFQRL